MSLIDSLASSASALSAERTRMDVTAENLANADTTKTANGGPYQRKTVVLQEAPVNGFGQALQGAMSSGTPSGVAVQEIVADNRPPRMKYDPSNPDANKKGYVAMPNIEPVSEMVDLITEQRSYEANVTAMQTAKQMFTKTLDLLK